MKNSHPLTHARSASQSIWTGVRPVLKAKASVVDVLHHLRRNLVFLVFYVLAFVASAAAYVKLLHPDFIATTQILLRPHVIVNDGPEDLRHFYQLVLDGDQCETELRVLSSQRLLYQVFSVQKLVDAPEIRNGSDGLWAFLGSQIDRVRRSSSDDSSFIGAFNAFLSRVRVRRLGLSYVLEISYRAHSAEQATKVVNAIASSYAAYRLRGVLAREQRRGVYRERRLSSMLGQITAAEEAAQFGIIPEDSLPDADVRLLGPASRPLGNAYPNMKPIVMMMGGLGLVSGLLLVLLSRGAAARHTNQKAGLAAVQGA